MRKFIILLVLSFFVGFPHSLISQQNINPREIKISELSDNQIRNVYNEMMDRGLSEQQATSLAMARGFTRRQIDQIKKRFEELEKEDSSREQKITTDTAFFDILSQKEDLVPTEDERRLFGFSFFNSDRLTFEPSVNIPVSKSYIIGPGDEISIDVWGASQQSYQLGVSNAGTISIPNAGSVAIGGLSLEDARIKIFDKLILIYRDISGEKPGTFANIYLGQIQPIKVHVIGEVIAPGSYSLPGSATAFNALYLSGGPGMAGSFRDIQVIRDGEKFKTLDVYRYLIDGERDVNIPLRDDDVILVPSYLKRVRMDGEFKRKGIFEAKEGETVSQMLRYAGGFTDKAYSQRIELYRNDSRQTLYKSISGDQFEDELIHNGDSIFAGEISGRIENRVIIEGAVMRPGNYELTPGFTLSGLLKAAEGVREDAFLSRGQVLRLDENLQLQNVPFDVRKLLSGEFDLELKREDFVNIYSIDSMRQNQDLVIKGEVQRPGTFDYREGTTLADLVMLSGGLLETASESYIEVARRLTHEEASEYQKRTGHLFQFTISRDLQLNNKDGQFELNPFDQVFVRRSPGYSESGTIRINGEVIYAGEYNLASREERLSSIIERAGGLTPDAYAQGAMLTRKVEIDAKTKRLRKQLMERDTTLQFGDLGFEVLAIDLKTAIEKPGCRNDVFLKDGDELLVPRELQTVKVDGEVLNPLSATFIEGENLRYYVDQSGGFSDEAKKGRAYVVYPNGKAASTKRFLFFNNYPKVLPGSEIVIPQKPERDPLPPTAWISIGSSVASLALTVVTIANTFK